MKIYIDNEYKCHASPSAELREFELPFFEGKCPEFIEGYRYLPEGEIWTREDGKAFAGEMLTPWKDYIALYILQLEYELAGLGRTAVLNAEES